MKKLSCLLLVFALLFVGVPTFASTDSPSSWAVEGVNYMIERGYVPDEMKSDYKKPITRLEFAKMVVNVVDNNVPFKLYPAKGFSDTADINARKVRGGNIITGYADGTFGPDKLITREQIAVMMSNSFAYMNDFADVVNKYMVYVADDYNFNDKNSFSTWSKPYINVVANAGIINGLSDGTFNPKGNVTREQAMVMFSNVLNNVEKNPHYYESLIEKLGDRYSSTYIAAIYRYNKGTNIVLDTSILTNKTEEELNSILLNYDTVPYKGDYNSFLNQKEYSFYNIGVKTTIENDHTKYITIQYPSDKYPINWTIGEKPINMSFDQLMKFADKYNVKVTNGTLKTYESTEVSFSIDRNLYTFIYFSNGLARPSEVKIAFN